MEVVSGKIFAPEIGPRGGRRDSLGTSMVKSVVRSTGRIGRDFRSAAQHSAPRRGGLGVFLRACRLHFHFLGDIVYMMVTLSPTLRSP